MHSPLTPSPTPDALRAQAAVNGMSTAARQRLDWVLHYLEHGRSLTETARHFGIARNTLQRWIERFDAHDLQSLEERSHEPHSVRQPTVPSPVVELIRNYRIASPLMGKERIAELLESEHGVQLSASSVGRVIERECFYFAPTPLHWKKRLHLRGDAVTSSLETVPLPEARQASAARPATAAAADCCVFCKIRGFDWAYIRRSLLLASILTNLAFVALLLGSAFSESRGERGTASLLHVHEVGDSSSDIFLP